MLFVAVGQNGTILISFNGVNWVQLKSGGNNLQSITYGNDTFVAVGWRGTILTSQDGVIWTRRTSPTRSALQGVAYGNSTFVAVSFYGAILTSP